MICLYLIFVLAGVRNDPLCHTRLLATDSDRDNFDCGADDKEG